MSQSQFNAGIAGIGVLGRRARGLLVAAAMVTAGSAVPFASASAQSLQLNVMDVSGSLAMAQPIFDNYQAENNGVVSRFTFTKAPAPELAGKLQAMQKANRMDIDIVLTGTDGLAAGMQLGIWEALAPHVATLGKPADIYHSGAAALQELAAMNGMLFAYSQQGPFIEYAPERVKSVPKSAGELLAWCKANPNKLIYARPANSGAGRTWLMALPYMLGDSNPKDPVKGWDKTWAYLKELNSCIEYYPSGTGAAFKEFGNGTRDIIITSMGWDIYPRALGTVPASAEVAILANTTFVSDGIFVAIPKGLSERRRNAALDVLKFILKPQQQAVLYDSGYLYPGPAVKDVTLAMAPKSSQDILAKFGRPLYDELIKKTPTEVLLEPAAMVVAFREWDERIGAGKGQ